MGRMGDSAEAHSTFAAISAHSSRCKVKRTPIILNYPRKPDAAHFRVLQWNVLADGLAQNGDFCKTPPGCLEWEYRRPLLLQEILEANADIICLQELNHFGELLQVLSGLGYEGSFRAKHSSPALKYEFPPDGMAVFYRRGRFRACAGGVDGGSFRDDSTGREQSQGFLQVLLYDKVVGRELLVVTTHLKAKDGAECEGVRLGQARQLLRHVEATLQRLHAGGDGTGGGSGDGAAVAAKGTGNGKHSNGNYPVEAAPGVAPATATVAMEQSATHGSGAGCPSGDVAAATHAADGARKGDGGDEGRPVGRCGRAPAACIPVLIAGDFNTMPGSKTCEAFRRHALGLQSLWEQRPLDPALISGSGSDLDIPTPLQQPAPASQQQQQQDSAPPPPPPPPSCPAAVSGGPRPGNGAAAAAAAAATAAAAAAAIPPASDTASATGPEFFPSPAPQQQQQQREQQQRLASAAAALVAGCGEPNCCAADAIGPSSPSSSGWAAAAAAAAAVAGCSRSSRSEFSTWKFRVKGESKRISDYIWFSGGGGNGGARGGEGGGGGPLRPLQRWRMLTEEEIGPGALPSAAYGSDHVSLCCEFEWDVEADLEWAPAAREEDWG